MSEQITTSCITQYPSTQCSALSVQALRHTFVRATSKSVTLLSPVSSSIPDELPRRRTKEGQFPDSNVALLSSFIFLRLEPAIISLEYR